MKFVCVFDNLIMCATQLTGPSRDQLLLLFLS